MQQAFTAATSWVMAHPWGTTHPYVIATNDDGTRTYIVGPEFSDGQVVVTFGRATSGVLELLNPTGGGGGAELADDLVTSAVVTGGRTASSGHSAGAALASTTLADTTATVSGGSPAVIHPGQGAIIQ